MAQRSYIRDASIAHKDNPRYWEIVHDDFVNDDVARLKTVCWLHIVSEFEKPVPAGEWTASVSFKVEAPLHYLSNMDCPKLRITACPVDASDDVKEELLLDELTHAFWQRLGPSGHFETETVKLTKMSDAGWFLLQLRPFKLTSDAVVKFEWKDIERGNWKEGLAWHCVDLKPYQPYKLTFPEVKSHGCGEVQWVAAMSLKSHRPESPHTASRCLRLACNGLQPDGKWTEIVGKADNGREFRFSVMLELARYEEHGSPSKNPQLGQRFLSWLRKRRNSGAAAAGSTPPRNICKLKIRFPTDTVAMFEGSKLMFSCMSLSPTTSRIVDETEAGLQDLLIDLEREIEVDFEVIVLNSSVLTIKLLYLYNTLLEFDWKENEHFSDFVIKSGSKTFKCHKVQLARGSKFFAAMLRQPEYMECQKNEVVIPDHFDNQVIENFLDFLYNGKLKSPTGYNEQLFEMADMYDVPGLRASCRAFLGPYTTE